MAKHKIVKNKANGKPVYKSEAGRILAENLTRLREADKSLSANRIGSGPGPAQTTVSNYIAGRSDPQLSKVEEVAKYLGLKTWQLLMPAQDMLMIKWWQIYNETTDTGRAILRSGIIGAEEEIKKAEGTGE